MSESPADLTTIVIWLILLVASCIHVFIDSKRDRHIGRPWMHAIMCAILWPLPYILWLLWWPGKLRQSIFGSDKDRARRKMGGERKRTSEPTAGDDGLPPEQP